MNDIRGFYFNYEDVTPGEKCYYFEQLNKAIENLEKQNYSEQRNKVKNFIWGDALEKSMNDFVEHFLNK